ncbi:MAG: HAD family hydrolase [Lachnospiraceae bacterium]
MKVFIVSNCQSGYIELFLKKTGLAPYVTDTECFGDTGMKKAENIRLVVARNGLQLPVYVGDTKGDEEAAHAAGVPFVHAAYGFGRAGQPEAVIETFLGAFDAYPDGLNVYGEWRDCMKRILWISTDESLVCAIWHHTVISGWRHTRSATAWKSAMP